jgi:hypothetical protein
MDNGGCGYRRYGIGFVVRLTILNANSETGLARSLEGFEIPSRVTGYELRDMSYEMKIEAS